MVGQKYFPIWRNNELLSWLPSHFPTFLCRPSWRSILYIYQSVYSSIWRGISSYIVVKFYIGIYLERCGDSSSFIAGILLNNIRYSLRWFHIYCPYWISYNLSRKLFSHIKAPLSFSFWRWTFLWKSILMERTQKIFYTNLQTFNKKTKLLLLVFLESKFLHKDTLTHDKRQLQTVATARIVISPVKYSKQCTNLPQKYN